MKKRIVCALLAVIALMGLLCGCTKKEAVQSSVDTIYIGTHGVGDDPRWRNPVTGESYKTFQQEQAGLPDPRSA